MVSEIQYLFKGLAADTKPTRLTNPELSVGSRYVAVDTGATFDWNGSAWVTAVATYFGDGTAGGGGGGGAVTIADGADAAQGAVADAAVANPASSATVVALLKGIQSLLIGTQVSIQPDISAVLGNITARDTASTAGSGLGGQSLVTGTATLNSTVSAIISGGASFSVQTSGTWTGTLQAEASIDGGTTWVPVSLLPAGGTSPATPLASWTGNGVLYGNASARSNVRVRATAVMTGTAAIRIQQGYGLNTVHVGNLQTDQLVQGDIASGATDSGSPVKIGLVYKLSQPTFADGQRGDAQCDNRGNMLVNLATRLDPVNDIISSNPAASATGGALLYHVLSAASTNAARIKNGAGTLYSLRATNYSTTAARTVKIYNSAANPPVPGTTTIFDRFTIPAAVSASQPSVVNFSGPEVGVAMGTGIGVSITAEASDAGVSAIAAGDVSLSIVYF